MPSIQFITRYLSKNCRLLLSTLVKLMWSVDKLKEDDEEDAQEKDTFHRGMLPTYRISTILRSMMSSVLMMSVKNGIIALDCDRKASPRFIYCDWRSLERTGRYRSCSRWACFRKTSTSPSKKKVVWFAKSLKIYSTRILKLQKSTKNCL